MSRRKQSAPCKVQDVDRKNYCALDHQTVDQQIERKGIFEDSSFFNEVNFINSVFQHQHDKSFLENYNYQNSNALCDLIIEPGSLERWNISNEIGCNDCFKIFISKYGLLMHKLTVHCTIQEIHRQLILSNDEQKECNFPIRWPHSLPVPNQLSGFHDLPFGDFSFSKFSHVAECHSNKLHNQNTKTLPIEDDTNQNDFLLYLGLQHHSTATYSSYLIPACSKTNNHLHTSKLSFYQVPSWLLEDIDDIQSAVHNGAATNIDKEEIFSCKKCKLSFSSAAHLENHKAITSCGINVKYNENGKRIFCCFLCKYKSFEKSTMIRHQRTHTGVRPFLCKLCRLGFTTKANCERHIRKSHRSATESLSDVKHLVFCDNELLNSAKPAEFSHQSYVETSKNASLSLSCRLCKEKFSSKIEGERHAMVKHGMLDRKKINDILCIHSSSTIKENGVSHSFEVDGEQPGHTLKGSCNGVEEPAITVTKLIPLLKIRSFHETAQKISSHYEREYEHLYSSLDESSSDLSGRLLSLLGSAAYISRGGDDNPSFDSIPFGFHSHDFDSDSHFTMNNEDQDQNGFTMMDQNDCFYPGSSSTDAIAEYSNFAVQQSKSREDYNRGRYRMILPKSKKNNKEKPSLKWRFIPRPPRMRDARGRYIRNPNLPAKPKPLLKPLQPSKNTHLLSAGGKHFSASSLHSKHSHSSMKTKKCPKCDKTFPWSSSLRRHIMIHSGIKPHVCSYCSMRFTTRSNMQRHMQRRHGHLSTYQGPSMVMTAPTYQLPEIQKNDDSLKTETENEIASEPQVEEIDAAPAPVMDASLEEEAIHFNKRYLCGKCRLPFANRSNVVRHLHRIHNITKDDKEFRSLLIRINKGEKYAKSKSKLNIFDSEIKESSPPPPLDVPLTFESGSKPFTCTICDAGFTKRNNAARHIQNQHRISRKSVGFHQLIARNNQAADDAPLPISENAPSGLDLVSLTSQINEMDSVKAKKLEDPPSSPSNNLALLNTNQQLNAGEQVQEEIEDNDLVTKEEENQNSFQKNRRRIASKKLLEGASNIEVDRHLRLMSMPGRKRDIRMSYFVCGVCKRVFKEVEDLKKHLDEHNIPHPWHCPICGVPFTNKFNCQRHIVRRHNVNNIVPKYVEDIRHGPRHPRKRSKSYGRR